MSQATTDTDAVLRSARDEILQALTIYPCHVTGMHNPEHTADHVCEEQLVGAVERLLKVIGATVKDLPHALEPGCGWCHRVPTQEHYRRELRELHGWAGVEISPELAAPAADAECFDLAEDEVLAAVRRSATLADGWIRYETIRMELGIQRNTGDVVHANRPLDKLVKAGRLEFRNGFEAGYSAQVRVPR
jgi:hypothetical protein